MGTSAPWRKAIGRLIGICIIAGAIVAIALTVWQWQVHPQTDDATVRANFIGVAPEVSGHIVELPVQDNQFVHEGDLLFVIDPRPYELALERAKAALLLTQKEVDALTKGVGVAEERRRRGSVDHTGDGAGGRHRGGHHASGGAAGGSPSRAHTG
jgi:multidrug efflux system membrane fusion protein